MYCNLRPPEPRQPFPALITTPMPSLTSLNLSIAVLPADILLYVVTLTFDFWHLTLNIYSVSSVKWWNFVINLNVIEQSAAKLLRFQCLTLWPWTCFKGCARIWDNFYQVWSSTTYQWFNYSVFWCWHVISIFNLKVWTVDLWKFVVHQVSRGQNLYEIWAKSSNSRLNYW